MRIFIAGIMQGSTRDPEVVSQDYRKRLTDAMAQCFPAAEIYDPWAGHTNSINYSDDSARKVFLGHNKMCREVDLLVAYVPEASMGTAIEMWEAAQGGAKVVAISEMIHNWAIRFTSDLIYPNVDRFVEAAKTQELSQSLGFATDQFDSI